MLGLHNDCTRKFEACDSDINQVERIMRQVGRTLQDTGYDPVNQIVGYLISGDPTYITNHQNARVIIRELERDQLLEELVRTYLERGRG
jgi:uncharacterized protein (UPF0297 family)